MNVEEKTRSNVDRMQKLASDPEHPAQVNLVPARVEHLTKQVFEETYETRDDFEAAWQGIVSEVLDHAEAEVARRKLTAGTQQMAGQLQLVK